MTTTRPLRFAALALLATALSGCISARTFEVRCIYDSNSGNWTTRRTYWDMGCTVDTVGDCNRVFEGLMQFAAPGDSSATDGKLDELWVEGDELCGRQILVDRDLPAEFWTDSTGVTMTGLSSVEILETNGRVFPDSAGYQIRWPLEAKYLRVRLKTTDTLYAFSSAQLDRVRALHGKRDTGKVLPAR